MGNALLAQSAGSGSGGGLEAKKIATKTNSFTAPVAITVPNMFLYSQYTNTASGGIYVGSELSTVLSLISTVLLMWVRFTSVSWTTTATVASGSTARAITESATGSQYESISFTKTGTTTVLAKYPQRVLLNSQPGYSLAPSVTISPESGVTDANTGSVITATADIYGVVFPSV